MLVLVVKASSDEWYQLRNVETVADVAQIAPSVIVEENGWKDASDDEFASCSFFRPEDYATIRTIDYRITIYDDYIE